MPETPHSNADKWATELGSAFARFAGDPGSEFQGALLVTQLADPNADVAWCEAEISQLALGLAENPSPEKLVTFLGEQGFRGSKDYYKFENSSLMHVLREREGIPISLAMVVLGVGVQVGLECSGINFPGHFLASVNGVLVDPFTMTTVDENQCRSWLKEHKTDPDVALRPASSTEVVLRMLNNLSSLAQSRQDTARALEITDYKLLISPLPLYVYTERVDLWLALGVVDMARHDLEQAIQLAPMAAQKAELQVRLDSLQGRSTRVH
jgi:regulator of sirC expression with transglutaminase-like and TPR domain